MSDWQRGKRCEFSQGNSHHSGNGKQQKSRRKKKEKKRQCNKIELKCSEGRDKGAGGRGRMLIMTPTHGENVEREHVNPMEVNADGIGRKEGEGEKREERRQKAAVYLVKC